MDNEALKKTASLFWYDEPGSVDRKFYGVFEGGGAKGIAYVGALRAMRHKRCWFRAVAGASAGAITAALVAAGMSPEQIESETDNALSNIKTGVRAGVKRLTTQTGYFSSDGLRDWLNIQLCKQLRIDAPETADRQVSFQELYDATGIELNIVAADLSMRCQIIFSHHDTPNCAVADAVAASSSIPFAFPSRLLQVSESTDLGEQIHHHTIVDGGVWSNFPIHVFDDEAFREEYGRVPQRIEPDEILGFILKETNEVPPPKGLEVKFVTAADGGTISAREWSQSAPPSDETPTTIPYFIGALLLYPFYKLGQLLDRNAGIERGRWPTPASRPAAYVLTSINGFLGGIHPFLCGLVAMVVVVVGSWNVASTLVIALFRGFPSLESSYDPLGILGDLVLDALFAIIIAIAILLPFVTLLGIAANRVFLRASRRILYGLVMTYVAGSGAPEWFGRKKNVVCLPIPPQVKTLSFNMSDDVRAELIAGAEQATLKQLAQV